MVLITYLSSKFNRSIASFLLRHSLTARYKIGRGIIRDNPTLDACLLLPFAQTLISLETHELSLERKHRQKEERDKFQKEPSRLDILVDVIWDRYIENRFTTTTTTTTTRTTTDNSIDYNNTIAIHQKYKKVNDDAMNQNNTRLEAFEAFLRPALVPNNLWSDVMRWQFHNRFIKWARSEYLLAKFEPTLENALMQYPQLLIANNSNNNKNNNQLTFKYLPSSKVLKRAMKMDHWKKKDTTTMRSHKNDDNNNLDIENNHDEYKYMEEIVQRLHGGSLVSIPLSQSSTSTQSQTTPSPSFLKIPNIHPDTDLTNLSVEDILELAGGHVKSCGPFNVLCETQHLYEYWTQEYVQGLSQYLWNRCMEFYSNNEGAETIILDVGAGNGFLTQVLRECMTMEREREEELVNNDTFLKQFAKKKSWKNGKKHRISLKQTSSSSKTNDISSISIMPQIIATDDGSWKIRPTAPVESLSVQDAVNKYGRNYPKHLQRQKQQQQSDKQMHQLIVLCSWMPFGEDWTHMIRKSGADEYILIGECDDGNCGHNFHTWGNPAYHERGDEHEEVGKDAIHDMNADDLIAPYLLDGYERINLDDLSALQFSRFDSSVLSKSHTVSFRKKKINHLI